jgi:hypothetical protein
MKGLSLLERLERLDDWARQHNLLKPNETPFAQQQGRTMERFALHIVGGVSSKPELTTCTAPRSASQSRPRPRQKSARATSGKLRTISIKNESSQLPATNKSTQSRFQTKPATGRRAFSQPQP